MLLEPAILSIFINFSTGQEFKQNYMVLRFSEQLYFKIQILTIVQRDWAFIVYVADLGLIIDPNSITEHLIPEFNP